jgi:haloalkane dehalogenase
MLGSVCIGELCGYQDLHRKAVISAKLNQPLEIVGQRPAPQLVSSIIEPSMILTEATPPDLPEWLRQLYPFCTRTLRIGPYAMSFVDEGPATAPAILLLHGNPTWSFLYRKLILRLRTQYRVVAPDTIGFGLSDKPDVPAYHTLEQHVANFVRLVEALDLRQLTLVMNGWGGPIGLGYAVAFPQNTARLVLTNTWGANLPQTQRSLQPLGMRVAASGYLGRWIDSWLNLSIRSAFSSRMCRRIADTALAGYIYPFRPGASRLAVSGFNHMFSDPDRITATKLINIQAGLKNVAAPADILCGAEDPVLSKLPAYLLRDDLRNAREPIFLSRVAHYLPEEDPETLAEVILRRQEQKSAPSSRSNLFRILS